MLAAACGCGAPPDMVKSGITQVVDPGGREALRLFTDDWERFVCVESANVRESAIRLAPGESHSMSLTISLSDQAV